MIHLLLNQLRIFNFRCCNIYSFLNKRGCFICISFLSVDDFSLKGVEDTSTAAVSKSSLIHM